MWIPHLPALDQCSNTACTCFFETSCCRIQSRTGCHYIIQDKYLMVPHNRQVCKCIVQVDKSLCQGILSLRARVACTPQLVRVYFWSRFPQIFRKWWDKRRDWLKPRLLRRDEWRGIGTSESNFTSQVLFWKLSAKSLPSSEDKWYSTKNFSCKIQSRTISLYTKPLRDSSIFWTSSKHSWHRKQFGSAERLPHFWQW